MEQNHTLPNEVDTNQEFDDAEVSLLEDLPNNKDDELSDLTDLLSQKLGAIKLDANENHIPFTNITNNVFGNAAISRKYADESSLRPANQFLTNILSRKQKIFIHGDTPSKLDRAVYLAIQDAKSEDLSKFSLLNEWLDYMRYCNPQEMQQWKTPKKPTLTMRLKN